MENQSLFDQSRALRWLFVLGVVAIPFDAVRGITAFGELGFEGSFPFLGAAVGLALILSLASGSNRISSSLALKVGIGLLAVIFLSWAINVASIDSAMVRERSGNNKFATSLLVIIYGISLSWLSEQLTERDVRGFLTKAIVCSALIATLYGFFELVGRTGPLSSVFQSIDRLVHTRQNDVINAWNGSVNLKVLYGWDPRLRSVSFEPPAFGNFCGLAWPWVWFAAVTAPQARKLRYYAILAAFTVIIIVGRSRTGMLILGVDALVIAALRFLYAPRRAIGENAAVLRLLLPILAVIIFAAGVFYLSSTSGQIVANVVNGDSVSDLSRLGFQIAALHLFLAHPIFGVGLGQFGFYAADYLPDWAFRSPEIPPMLYYPDAPWPTIYSLYGRLAAELGLIGLIGWIALWLTLAWRMMIRAREQAVTGASYGIEYPLIASIFGILMSGIASETFRTPMFWITLGCSCALLRSARAVTADVRSAQAPSSAPALRHSR